MENLQQEPIKIAVVGLDLSEMDDQLIKYTAMLSRILSLERIFFVHVAKELELSKDLIEKYPDLLAPLDESIEKDIQKKVDLHFPSSGTDVKCLVKDGHPIEEILKISRIKGADLILMGRKKDLQGSGLVSSRIARKCPCSLLLVTENFDAKIQTILVPVDFSEHSFLAVNQALRIAEKANSEMRFSHAYSVPIGYYKTGKTYEEFARIMKGHAENELQQFLLKHNFPANIPCEYLLMDDGKQDELIYGHAKREHTDLIVIGSKGRTDASAMLIGSLAEKLVYKDVDIPVLIVKNKGENMSFLEAFMRV